MAVKSLAPDHDLNLPATGVRLTRLKKRRDFLAARNGARSHERAFVFQLMKSSDHHSSFRVGYTVTKITGNSVERNRIRRRLREAAKQAYEQQNDPQGFIGFDGVLIARREAMTMPFRTLIAEIDRAMGRCLKRTVANLAASGQKRQQRASRHAV